MATTTTETELPTREDYERMAYEYMATLPLEHYMEGIPNATQRKITIESFDLITVRRRDVRVFSELLVQYPRPKKRNGQVVPDNMVTIGEQPVEAEMSFNVAYELVSIFMVLEYVSRSRANQRKDYVKNRKRYETELKVPYYLLYDPDEEKLTFLHLESAKYADVKPNANGRLPIPELELEVAVLDGWVRFWYQGRLLPLPGEMQAELDELQQRAKRAEKQAERAQLETAKEKKRAEDEKKRAEDEKKRAEDEKKRADAEAERARKLTKKLRDLGVDPD